MNTELQLNQEMLHLLVEPEVLQDSVRDPITLTNWIAENKAWLEDKLLGHGGILFRGYGFDSPEAFERFSNAISAKKVDYKPGFSPRHGVRGNVFTSTDLQSDVYIPIHSEMSYLNLVPKKICFYCHEESTQGGQTPLVDMQKVCESLDPQVRHPFVEKGVSIIQTFPEKHGPSVVKTWCEVFDTADRDEVESICQARGIDFFWNPDDSLHMILTRPATIEHPITGKTIWFNQAHLNHNSAYLRKKRFYYKAKASLLHFIESQFMRNQEPSKSMTHCTFGDGTEIPVEYIKHISSVLQALSVTFDWHRGGCACSG